MRILLSALFLVGCSQSRDTNSPPPDLIVPLDLSSPADLTEVPDYKGVQCGSAACAGGDGGELCCTSLNTVGDGGTSPPGCAAICPDSMGELVAACDGPEDCGAGSPYCCAAIDVAAGNPPECPANVVELTCQPRCDGNLAFTCPMMGALRACHTAADCADNADYANCCSMFNLKKVAWLSSYRLCVTNTIKIFGGATCY
jgi:hypothetical protein